MNKYFSIFYLIGISYLFMSVKVSGQVVRAFDGEVSGIRANSELKCDIVDGRLKIVYPKPTRDPSFRDVWIETEVHDWSKSEGIVFTIFSDKEIVMSLSFLDGNNVAYTAWVNLKAKEDQEVLLKFDEIKLNPYFQPPHAQKGKAKDIGDIKAFGISPQNKEAGRIELGTIMLFPKVEIQ